MSQEDSSPNESSSEAAEAASRMYPPPANFRLFLESLLSQAWVALGKFPNPMTGETQFEEAWARYYIDMVGLIEDKTKGNLEKDEAQLIEVNLSSLRLTFVEEQKSQSGDALADTGSQADTDSQADTGTLEDTSDEESEAGS